MISELALRVRPAPRARRYEGVFFEDFAAGAQALRALAQEQRAPDVARLSDEAETRMSLALARRRAGSRRAASGARTSACAATARGCLAILGFEGAEELERRGARGRWRWCAATAACRSAARRGRRGCTARFAAPYLRDELLTHGVMVETLETATQWSNLRRLHRERRPARSREALRAQGTPGLVMCHVSHVYETGASLYFTFLARQREGDEIEQWRAVKARRATRSSRAAARSPTTTRSGATTRRGWRARSASTGVAALRALKAELDPPGS